MNHQELEAAISKLTLAIVSRNCEIVKDLMAYLRIQFTLQEVSGLVLVTLERLLRLDVEALLWAVEHPIPVEVMGEIRKMTSVAVYQRLIKQGFVPGKDLSVDAAGCLLLSHAAKSVALR